MERAGNFLKGSEFNKQAVPGRQANNGLAIEQVLLWVNQLPADEPGGNTYDIKAWSMFDQAWGILITGLQCQLLSNIYSIIGSQ